MQELRRPWHCPAPFITARSLLMLGKDNKGSAVARTDDDDDDDWERKRAANDAALKGYLIAMDQEALAKMNE